MAGKPSTSEPRKRPPHLSLPSLSFLPVNATAPQKKPFPMLLGSVNFPSSDLPLVNRITFFLDSHPGIRVYKDLAACHLLSPSPQVGALFSPSPVSRALIAEMSATNNDFYRWSRGTEQNTVEFCNPRKGHHESPSPTPMFQLKSFEKGASPNRGLHLLPSTVCHSGLLCLHASS